MNGSICASSRYWIRRSLLAAVLWSGLSSAACNRVGCDGNIYEAGPTKPLITNVEYLYTVENDPWTIVFAISFTDSDGDTGPGSALFYINGSDTPALLPLADFFEQSEISATATEGRFAMPLRFDSSISDGSIVRLGTQLEDASAPDPDGHFSNCYSLDLHFDVTPATSVVSEALHLATTTWDLLRPDP